MNSIKDFLDKGILVERAAAEELMNINFSLVDILKASGITFVSKKDLNYRASQILENLKNLQGVISSEEKKGLDEERESWR